MSITRISNGVRKKILLVSFVLSLPFWWGINFLADNLENFWFQQELASNPALFTAQLNQQILEKKLEELKVERLQTQRLQELDIQAKAAISLKVDENGNEKILFEKNREEVLSIASLTKLMTALVVFDLDETYNPSQIITITQEAFSQEGQSKYGDLRVGEKLSVETLLHIMLIESSNDAAFTLTELVGEKGFVDLINLYAKQIGLSNTQFVNPTGIEPDYPKGSRNTSTARDLVKLAKYILENYPQIFEITVKQFYTVLKPDGSIHHFIPQNTNELLGEFPEIIGGKTGWGPQAGGCLLLVLKNPKWESFYINVLLGAEDRFTEMRKLIEAINIDRDF